MGLLRSVIMINVVTAVPLGWISAYSRFIGTLNGWRWTKQKCQGQLYSAVSVGSPEFQDGVSSSDKSYSLESSDGAVTVPISWEPDIQPRKISVTKRLSSTFTSRHCAFRNCPLQLTLFLKAKFAEDELETIWRYSKLNRTRPCFRGLSKLDLNLKLAMFWVGGWTRWSLEAYSSLNYSLILWSEPKHWLVHSSRQCIVQCLEMLMEQLQRWNTFVLFTSLPNESQRWLTSQGGGRCHDSLKIGMRLLLKCLVRMAWGKNRLKRDYQKRENCSRCIQQVQKKKEEKNAAVVGKSSETKVRGFKRRYFDKSETAKIPR